MVFSPGNFTRSGSFFACESRLTRLLSLVFIEYGSLASFEYL